jgi:hypothetical protein
LLQQPDPARLPGLYRSQFSSYLASDAEERLGRLYAAIEAGTIDGTDPSLKERVAALKNARDRAVEAADYARKSSALPVQIDPIAIDRFTRLMREQLVSGDVAARKAYLASIVDAVIVSENKIRIMGSNDNIRSTFGPKGQPTPVVRKSVQGLRRGELSLGKSFGYGRTELGGAPFRIKLRTHMSWK